MYVYIHVFPATSVFRIGSRSNWSSMKESCCSILSDVNGFCKWLMIYSLSEFKNRILRHTWVHVTVVWCTLPGGREGEASEQFYCLYLTGRKVTSGWPPCPKVWNSKLCTDVISNLMVGWGRGGREEALFLGTAKFPCPHLRVYFSKEFLNNLN